MATYFNDKTGKWEDDSGREIDPTSGRTATVSPDVAEAGANAAAARKEALAQRNVQSLVNAAGGAVKAPEPAPAAAPDVGNVITKPDGTTILAPPPQSFKESDYSKTTKQSQATAGEVVAQGALQNALEAKKDAIRDQAVVDREKAGVTAEHEQGELARQQRVEKARNDAIAWGEQEYARRRQDLDTHLSKVENFQFRDYWSNKSSGDKVLAGIGVALGALGSALTGQESRALGIIREAVKEDREHQMQELQKLERIGERKREALGIAKEEFEMRKNNLEYAEVAGLQVAKQALAAKLAKAGLNESQIKANADMVKLDEEIARSKIAFEEKNRKDITTQVQSRQRQVEGVEGAGGGKPAPLGEREKLVDIDKSIAELEQLEKTIAGNPDAYKEYAGAVRSWQQSEARDKFAWGPAQWALSAGKASGVLDVALDQKLKSSDSKNINQGMSVLEGNLAKRIAGGAPSDKEYAIARSALAAASRSPQEMAAYLRGEREKLLRERATVFGAGAPASMRNSAAENAPVGAAAPTMTNTAPAAVAPESGSRPERRLNKKTGQVETVYRHADGRLYAEP